MTEGHAIARLRTPTPIEQETTTYLQAELLTLEDSMRFGLKDDEQMRKLEAIERELERRGVAS